MTRREKRKVVKIACLGLDIQNTCMIIGIIGVWMTGITKLCELDIFNISFIITAIIWMVYCLSRIIFDGYIDLAEDIEEGRIR